MSVLKRDDYISRISSLIGEENTDENIQILEDLTDTFDSLSNNGEWEQRYNQLDREWREKYRKRFLSPSSEEDEEPEEPAEAKPLKFEDLFSIEE